MFTKKCKMSDFFLKIILTIFSKKRYNLKYYDKA